ncbi:Eukaryotic translation initiation factor 4E [Pyrenophora seminiperda CCB06]|uniref:Eukaryotic translation initiation factor 4E n=1 Tax=Pyrenophora seminiperda CCB06 TaxID=1302712 RepID=A0A3M7MFZ0_9PLEO|nr:Eukaryotic translation initiation factor 4E [Pyrenophora seminiperda CCB06]
MPTHTPSPHRFLAPNPPSTQKSQKPHSSLRNALAIQTPTFARKPAKSPELQFKQLTPAKRFVVAPAQHKTTAAEHGKGEDKNDAAQRQQHEQATPRPKPPRKFERVESIEASQELETDDDEDEEMLFDTAARNKRRRTSPPSSPSLQESAQPQTPAPTTNRFKAPPPRTPAPFPSIATVTATTPVSASASHRPHFILPVLPTSPPKPAKPPPDIFSPSRKVAKYTPGGMASTVTSWIIETANTGFAAQDRSAVTWGRDREDGVKIRVRITELSKSGAQGGANDGVGCYAGGVVFARGHIQPAMHNESRASIIMAGDEELNVLVAGQGGARGSGGVRVKIGSLLGVRLPAWDVDIRGRKWLVAVDWILL